jgi:hypothetical protein
MSNQLELNLLVELEKSEAIIENGLETFVDVGRELLRIRDLKLYTAKGEFSSFEAYCKERWSINRRRAYQLLDAAKTVGNLESEKECTIVHTISNSDSPIDESGAHTSSLPPAPTHETQVRPLTVLKDPEQQRRAWKLATENNSKPTQKDVEEAVRVVKSGTVAKPKGEVPSHLMRGIITPDMVGKGYAVCSDVNGDPCSLQPGESELEHHERVPHAIGGSNSQKDRKSFAKWERYADKNIRQKVLKVLESMSPLDVPKAHTAEAFTYEYDLGKASDLKELVIMLNADLLRAVETLELKEKYGHIQP